MILIDIHENIAKQVNYSIRLIKINEFVFLLFCETMRCNNHSVKKCKIILNYFYKIDFNKVCYNCETKVINFIKMNFNKHSNEKINKNLQKAVPVNLN